MTRVLDRLKSGRSGLVVLVLLVLLVLVIAHALVMGGGHDADMACGSCVVVVASGIAAAVALRPHHVALAASPLVRLPMIVRVGSKRPVRPPSLRSVILRL